MSYSYTYSTFCSYYKVFTISNNFYLYVSIMVYFSGIGKIQMDLFFYFILGGSDI